VALVEDRQRQRHVDRPHCVYGADRHVSRLHASEPLQLGVRRVHLGQDPSGASDEELTGVGDRDASRRPLHERHADLLLEATDLLGEGGLCDVLTRGRAGEMSLLGERHEVAQLAQFHKHSL
jgi:hypothetical protein